MNTYTPNAGLTPQGQAITANQPNQTNSVPPPNSPSSSYGSWDSLNSNYAGANANNVTANSPATRQALVSNSDIPAEQNNYEQLAKQLFEYDQGTLSPKFQGQNPGTPTDAASFGRVEASPLGMTMGSAGLPSSSGTYNSNPKYAYSSQMDMGNSLASLLGVLNNAIRDSMTDVKGKNASNVSTAQAALEGIYKLMSLKQDAEDKAASRASSGGLAGQKLNDARNSLLADAKKGVTFTDLLKTYSQDLSPFEIKNLYNQVNYYGKPASESADDINAIINGQKPAAQAARDKATQQKKDALNITKSTIQNLLGQYNNLGPLDKGGLIGGTLAANPYGAGANYENQRRGLVAALKDIAGAGAGSGVRVTNAEIQGWMKLLPSPGDTSANANRNIISLNKQLIGKFGVGLDPEYLPQGAKIHITDGNRILEFDKNDPEAQKALKNGWREK